MANHRIISALHALQAFGLETAPRRLLGHGATYRVEGPGGPWVLKPTRSQGIAPWCRALAKAGVRVVTPCEGVGLNPIDDPLEPGARAWVLYPFIEGEVYAGTEAELEAAGQLLGQIHHHELKAGWGLPVFEGGGVGLAEGLPLVAGSFDFKAANLVFASGEPILIDPDNGAILPRLYDLAIAWGAFHLDSHVAGLPRPPLTPSQWMAFLTGYGAWVELTPQEQASWPRARQLAFDKEVRWHLEHHRGLWGGPGREVAEIYRALDLRAYPCVSSIPRDA